MFPDIVDTMIGSLQEFNFVCLFAVAASVLMSLFFMLLVLSLYWAHQAGLLTPLNFAWHRLSPLAAFTSSAYFFTMEGSDSEFANFTVPTLKTVLEAHSQNVSGNEQ